MKNYIQIDTTLLGNVHNQNKCAGTPCVIHNPSEHHMRGWTYVWIDVPPAMWRVCSHGLQHPDPDEIAFQLRRYGSESTAGLFIHTCDACCQTPPNLIPEAPPQTGTVSIDTVK